ncbi:sensor histidine kinase [Streptosporangium sp. NPDC000396]|uniref:sensor histidine kinase n=1 Tax=Streptosporangium sp. NPDC000396 TaxID=3366185 RepID=UPI0036A95473
MKLSTRFAVCFAALVPLLVLLAGLLVLRLASHDLYAERDRRLTVRLRALTPVASLYARQARLGITPDFLGQRLAVAATAAESPGGVYLDVIGAEPLAIGDVPAVLPAAGAPGPADFAGGGRQWRYAAADLGWLRRKARLWVFEPEEHLAAQRGLLRSRVVVTTLVAAGVGAVAGLGLGRFAVRPLAVLHRQARVIDMPARAGTRLATGSGVAEIDELAGLLNDLLDRRDAAVARTGEALETARAFAATAAHELRTPLTSMGTNLSLLGRPDLDPADRAEVIADLSAEHGRIQRLITMLRRLARGELLDPATFADVDLTEIVVTAIEDARRRHPRATITASLTDDLLVRGWAEGLQVIADNLLDNAATHGADDHGHAEIVVTLSADAEVVVLSVQDTGPGIGSADRESVFARFHRRAGSPGSGLGLTLVRQQAVLHGGTAAVADPRRDAGARVDVRLPVAGRPARHSDPRSWLEWSPGFRRTADQ